MKVLIDIAHPAHIHYFRNFASIFRGKGHEVLFTLRNKGIIPDLARSYSLDSVIRSGTEKSKLLYALQSVFSIFRIARKFRPDIFIDMGTIFSAPAAWLLRKPHIVFDDTESAYKARRLFMPLISVILTPELFQLDLGKKHLRFKSLMELFYLHRNYYVKKNIRAILGLKENENYVIMRFVSWEAHHDTGLSGLSPENRIKAVKEFSRHARVFINSESLLPAELRPYQLKTEPDMIHDVLADALLYFGEGATMAMESVILGTPAVYLNQNWLGNSLEAEKQGLQFNFRTDSISQEAAIEKGLEILRHPEIKSRVSYLSEKYFNTRIDPTAFLVWFSEQWPESYNMMKDNPEYQNRFQ